tara:strand:- start:1458 stop:1694 length:237 start_codon:yes stop_codon:yes gene_type:complete
MIKDHVWYIKYASAITILIAMLLHTLGVTPWNAYVQLIGATGWCYVGYKWNEKALLLNFLPQFAIIIPTLVWIYWINV